MPSLHRWTVLGFGIVVALGWASSATAQTITSRVWSDPQPGLRLLEGRTSSPPTRFYALFVDLCTDYVHVDATAPATARRTASSWAASVGATAVVNGDFFEAETPPRVYGIAAGASTPWPRAQTGESAAASSDWYYRNQGWIAFGPGWADFDHTEWVKANVDVAAGHHGTTVSGAIPEGTRALVSGFPELVTEGRQVTCTSPTAPTCFPDRTDMRARHPRTAMGLTADRRTFILLVVDGRSSVSVGMYGSELASLMSELGAWQAFNLDGGGSSQMWLSGRGTVNAPSDGTARTVANHWGVFAGSTTGRGRAPTSCMPLSIDECVVRSADGTGCEIDDSILEVGASDADTTTDVDGDGLADVCIRTASDFRCQASSGTFLETMAFRIPDMGDASGFDEPQRFSTIRMGDVDGDGLADVCARFAEGVRCYRSLGGSVAPPIAGPAIEDAGGWWRPQYGSTMRLGDLDGDGRDDVCARAAAGLRCWLSMGDGFGAAIAGPEWSDTAGFDHPKSYTTIHLADVDGDRRADVCARGPLGIECVPFDGAAFGAPIAGPAWSDASGWDAIRFYSTIRFADVDGDGRADVCARSASDLRCHLSTGGGFGPALTVAAYGDTTGWADHGNYATVRTGDVDGDGDEEICIRANAGIRCFRHESGTFTQLAGPALADESGWDHPRFYSTLRLADVTGDGLMDLCARASAGMRCWPSTGTGFGDALASTAFDDTRGFDDPIYYSTLRIAGPSCVVRSEACNGADDDCDGAVDEGCGAERPTDGGVQNDAGHVAGDAMPPPGRRGGADGTMTGGCSIASRTGGTSTLGWLAWGILAVGRLRRGRRSR